MTAGLKWRIGSIGFSYKDWRGAFYPQSVRPPDYLSFYASRFDTVELDTTFHAVPPPARVAGWASSVPDDFRFVVKTPRAITHEPGFAEKLEGFDVFARSLGPLDGKLGLVLLQFPPATGTEIAGPLHRLIERFGRLPLAVEVRHPSWFVGRALQALHAAGVVVVANDYHERVQPVIGPSDRLCVRLIGVHGRFPVKDQERYDVADRLKWWVERVREKARPGATVFVTATNDYAGHSPATARRLRAIVGLPGAVSPTSAGGAGTLFE